MLTVANSASVDYSGVLHDVPVPLLDLSGAGWEYLKTDEFPANLSGWIAGIAAVEPAELNKRAHLRFEAATNHGSDYGFSASLLIPLKRSLHAEGIPIREPFAVPFRLPVEGPCVVTVRVLVEDAELARYQFSVLAEKAS
jgi:hypothetical protein